MNNEDTPKHLNLKLADNFLEIEPGLTKQDANEEANRCLYCYDAPCIQACPTGIDIPAFIKKIATGNLKGSAKTIMLANPVGASCSRVCPTDELCEGACVLNNTTKPIMIGNLQRFATDWAIHNNLNLFKASEWNGKAVAVIGSGPAGLSSARELARLGYKVTIYEANKKAGGLNTYGIVSFRLPTTISYWEVKQVEQLGVEIITDTKVGRDISAKEILEKYDFTIFSIGMGNVPNLKIPGEKFEGVYDAIQLIKETKTNEIPTNFIGKKVVVIGAGNTAIDAATCSIRLGAENVKILYRRTSNEMTAYQFEYEFAKQDGVEFRWLTLPKQILSKGQQVTGIECLKIKLSEKDEYGRRNPEPIDGSEHVIEADIVIKAIGQTRHLDLIEEFGLKHNDGVVEIDPITYQTSNPNVFACGDVVFGKGKGDAMVVTAAQQGKLTALSIHQYNNQFIV
ncbi:NAD(P)-dependent oxidoreductase [Litchfieldia alkalitelluris]|uniref:NAD(P)-dependent oxidoreductase n=1 Tax=Litchfieldia alkalitelluris TaxID=304268 RepID=UPI001F425206|nr:NAD(P)-dependent oxidoreductase [Litchfieldia alkalitelluris]